jgi:hypothetical protein
LKVTPLSKLYMGTPEIIPGTSQPHLFPFTNALPPQGWCSDDKWLPCNETVPHTALQYKTDYECLSITPEMEKNREKWITVSKIILYVRQEQV